MVQLNKNIEILGKHTHSKASEEYVDVVFYYLKDVWKGWIPIVYRRTGLDLKKDEDINDYLNKVYKELEPKNHVQWSLNQLEFWKTKPKALITQSFYDVLSDLKWHCVNCELPVNPNWARRIQDLKEFGYTIATDTKRYCNKCNANKTHLIMLPLKRLSIEGNGYETWSPSLRKKIVKSLNEYDVYECRYNPNCLPDHKFSEIRWDENTKEENPNDMSFEEIKAKFQLLTNQRNQQKREVCRECYQTGKRGVLYGIPFFYEGDALWDPNIPRKGKDAERGCVGCGWYDLNEWRKKLIELIENGDDKR